MKEPSTVPIFVPIIIMALLLWKPIVIALNDLKFFEDSKILEMAIGLLISYIISDLIINQIVDFMEETRSAIKHEPSKAVIRAIYNHARSVNLTYKFDMNDGRVLTVVAKPSIIEGIPFLVDFYIDDVTAVTMQTWNICNEMDFEQFYTEFVEIYKSFSKE